MSTPLIERISWREFQRAAVGSSADASTLARTHAYMYFAGATLTLLALVLPSQQEVNDLGILACSLAAYTITVTMIVGFDRLPRWSFWGCQVAGTVLITLVVYFSGESTSAYATMYVWVALYAAHLLGRIWTTVQITAVAVAYALVLMIDPEPGRLESWLLVVGSAIVVGVIVLGLKERLDGLIEELEWVAKTDPLTGMLNRRGFEQALEVELERSRRTGAGLSLLAGDLDEFKAYNDHLGHAAGDRALERVSRIVRDGKRRVDVAARLGGEEFAVLVPGGDQRNAFTLAERLREEVHEAFALEPISLTISFGVASSSEIDSGEELMEGADRALYVAKRSGRDRSEVSVPPPTGAQSDERFSAPVAPRRAPTP